MKLNLRKSSVARALTGHCLFVYAGRKLVFRPSYQLMIPDQRLEF